MFELRLKGYRKLLVMLSLSITLLFAGCAGTGGGGQSLQNVDGSVVVKGTLRNISLPENTLTIKPRKGDSVTVLINGETEFAGGASASSLAKNQPVEITYKAAGSGNIALVVKQLPEGACQ